MELLFSTPYLLRVILSLIAILVFQKILKRLDLAMIMGIFILALWTGQSLSSTFDIAAKRLFSANTGFLALMIAEVIWLSALMSESGIMKDLVQSLRPKLSRRAMLAALPAVVGLLPMPAGALFSCPLVQDADEENTLTGLQKTDINFWFRHVWEFWWPLYPGVLLAVDLTGLNVFSQAALMFPVCLAAVGGGWFFLLRSVGNKPPAVSAEKGRSFFILILPTLTVIAVYGFILTAVPRLAEWNRYFPMVIGVTCGLAVIQFQRPLPGTVWKKHMFAWRTISLVAVVILARVYGAFVETRLSDGTLLMERIRGELDIFGIPALALIMIIPFISGLTTGITIGYIGASFPVILPLAGSGVHNLYTAIIIGYACGFIGMMLSPIHVCLIVTNEYFHTKLASSIRGLVGPALAVFVGAMAYAWLWQI